MEQVPEDARVSVRSIDGAWVVRVAGDGEVIEQSFADEDEAEEFAHAHRTRLGLVVPPDVS
jgi:predicted regulator of Ras-like GTPase activity (Roadblock/LC7/MglB family)